MSGRLGPQSYVERRVSDVLHHFSLLSSWGFQASNSGRQKEKYEKYKRGKNLISVIIVKSVQARRAPE